LPLAFEATETEVPLEMSVTITFAPGMAAPVLSVTVPKIDP